MHACMQLCPLYKSSTQSVYNTLEAAHATARTDHHMHAYMHAWHCMIIDMHDHIILILNIICIIIM